MAYASNTTVPVYKSHNEIRTTLSKYGASAFAFAENVDRAVVQFEMSGKRLRFILPLPLYGKTKNKKGVLCSRVQVEQLIRSKWRGLALAIKAKLECVDAGISTLEEEFMANIMLPNGHTVGEVMLPEIDTAYQSGKMPALLGMR